MAIRNTKTESAYKAEFNALIVGATAMLARAVQVRKNIASLGKKGNKYSTGPVAVKTASISASLAALPTFKGEGERNPKAPAARR